MILRIEVLDNSWKGRDNVSYLEIADHLSLHDAGHFKSIYSLYILKCMRITAGHFHDLSVSFVLLSILSH